MSYTYSPQTIIYYGAKGNNSSRLTPAPDFTVSLEYQYSNDSIIGYSYIITLKGYATALDLSSVNYGGSYNANTVSNRGIGGVTDHINKLRKILSQNGNILYVVNGSDNAEILRAKGGILRSFSIDEASNNWTHYAPYTATIEFNTIDFMDSADEGCNTFLDPQTYASSYDSGMVNIDKFKLKSFNDSWSFTFDENESFARVRTNDTGQFLDFNNTSFSIEYQISAVGRNFYDYDNPASSTSAKILPAWEQAKNFAQYRLYYQVTNLIDSVLKNTYPNACSNGEDVGNLNVPGSSANGLLKDLGNNSYGIYNETISCDVSESEGSFSATYNAIVKSKNTNISYGSYDTKHTIKKSHSIDNASMVPIPSISIEGTIEGLVEGGLIRSSKPLILPSQGSLFIANNGAISTKYAAARTVLNKIHNPLDYSGGVGEAGKRDLKSSFKQLLGITPQALNMDTSQADTVADPPHPTSFNITHDYLTGTINYTAEYSSNTTCGRKFRNISIDTNMPTKVIAVFNVPNSNSCPVVQDILTYTAKSVSVTVQGVDLSDTGQPGILSLDSILDSCGSCFSEAYLPITIPQGAIITDKTYTSNPLDGSFTVNLSYICSEGCDI